MSFKRLTNIVKFVQEIRKWEAKEVDIRSIIKVFPKMIHLQRERFQSLRFQMKDIKNIYQKTLKGRARNGFFICL